MQITYILLSLITISYFVFKKRDFDFFTIYSFSIIIYYFPAYFGYIYNQQKLQEGINDVTYLILILNLSIILWFAILYDYSKNKFKKIEFKNIGNFNNDFSVLIVSFITFGLVLMSVKEYGVLGSGTFNKVQLLSSSNKLIEYTKYFSTFIFVYAFTNKGQYTFLIKIISLLSILFTFMLGHRSFLVIGIIAIMYHVLSTRYNFNNLLELFLKNKTILFFIGLFGAFIFFVKNVFAAFMSGRYDIVKERLITPEYYIQTLLESEPNTITGNLNDVLQSGMDYEIISYLAIILFGLIPLLGNYILNSMNIHSFEYMLQVNFNTQMHEGIGLGSTFLGESYSTGGVGFVFITCVLVCVLILILQKSIYKFSNPLVQTWFLIFLVYLTFYISRNSFVFILISARAYLYILILTLIIQKVAEFLPRKKKQNKNSNVFE